MLCTVLGRESVEARAGHTPDATEVQHDDQQNHDDGSQAERFDPAWGRVAQLPGGCCSRLVDYVGLMRSVGHTRLLRRAIPRFVAETFFQTECLLSSHSVCL